jgi:lipid-A-disaccharide synthase
VTPPPIQSASDREPALLFTAFEPSGDDHASAVIAELRRRHPSLTIYAWGGPKMQQAGATIQERTGDDAVMGLPGIAKVLEHLRINARIDAFMAANPVTVHVPVDSPSANTSICAIAKRHGARVVHLVAPQIWAWGRWRIHKLRRLTDMVLCILPFEEEFFRKRYVPARFIGHFLFDQPLDLEAIDRRVAAFAEPAGGPRLAMMPGSRPDELRRHFPILLEAFRALKVRYPQAQGVVAATSDRVATLLRDMAVARGGWPGALQIVVQDTDAVIRWCDVALVKSGTVTMQVARQRKPMVVFYKKSNPLLFLVARMVLSTRVFSLPNVLAHRRVIPEFIPHFGGPVPIVQAVEKLIDDPAAAQAQRDDLDALCRQFDGYTAAELAADSIEEYAGLTRSGGTGKAKVGS